MQVGELPRDPAYLRNTRAAGRFYKLQQINGYVVPECNTSGQLTQGYCLVQKTTCTSSNATSSVLLMCSCAQQQRCRIEALPEVIDEDNFAALIAEEEAEYCIHARSIPHLFGDESTSPVPDKIDNEVSADFLSLDPPLVAMYDGSLYGLIGRKRTTKLQCLLCNGRCKHVSLFNTWYDSNNIHFNPEEALQDEATFPSVSSTPIPYPLPCSLQSLHDKYESGKWEFPLALIPPVTEAQT